MRKDLLALGTFLLFFGLVFASFSRVATKPEPTQDWVVVEKTEVLQPTRKLSVQGNLRREDRFRTNFDITLAPQAGPVLPESMIEINLTDPNGDTESHRILIGSEGGQLAPEKPFPEGIANYTGTYKVDARTLGGLLLSYSALEKMEIKEKEPQYPYANLFPIGIAIFSGGFGIFLLGVKLSKRKIKLHKRRLRKRKTRSQH